MSERSSGIGVDEPIMSADQRSPETGDGVDAAPDTARRGGRQIQSLSSGIALTFATSIILFFVGGVLHSGFLHWDSLSSVLVLASFIGFVAAGQTLTILTGGIDLSVPWVITTGGVLLTVLTSGSDTRAIWAIPATLAAGAGIGVINGIGITRLKVPPIVMTLGMNGIVEGAVLWLTKGFTASASSASAPHVIGQAAHGKAGGFFPIALVIWVVVALLMWLLLSRLVLGRWIYAIGNSVRASFLAGGRTQLVTIAVYALSGLFAALTGIMLAGYSGQAELSVGDPYLFSSITAVVVGGASILGGRGNYTGTIAGAILVMMLSTVLELANISVAAQDIAYGIVILIALALYAHDSDQ
jgi:ribose transport system permease protein